MSIQLDIKQEKTQETTTKQKEGKGNQSTIQIMYKNRKKLECDRIHTPHILIPHSSAHNFEFGMYLLVNFVVCVCNVESQFVPIVKCITFLQMIYHTRIS